ncbi:MAG: type II toxin-antitoxin system RelE/ParE family toxin [Planctomycetaceae bacterium]
MAAELVVAPEAEADIEAAYAWYEERRHGLGEDFLSSVDACIQQILRMPELHGKVHHDYRRALVRRFPFAVFYEFDADAEEVTIYCVFHTSRDPEKWRERLSG